jgi:hypothetical protein
MKKIPEAYELDEDDIREAITYWLNEQIDDGFEHDFDITLNAEEVPDTEADTNYKGPRGGMYEPPMKKVFSAKAEKE